MHRNSISTPSIVSSSQYISRMTSDNPSACGASFHQHRSHTSLPMSSTPPHPHRRPHHKRQNRPHRVGFTNRSLRWPQELGQAR
jgi:hypothetical protein